MSREVFSVGKRNVVVGNPRNGIMGSRGSGGSLTIDAILGEARGKAKR